jgi:hypothetical protein
VRSDDLYHWLAPQCTGHHHLGRHGVRAVFVPLIQEGLSVELGMIFQIVNDSVENDVVNYFPSCHVITPKSLLELHPWPLAEFGTEGMMCHAHDIQFSIENLG